MGKKTGGFQALGLDAQLLKGVLGMYSQPTPVQRAVLPAALEGRDVACMAELGVSYLKSLGVCSGFTSVKRVVSEREGGGWSLFRF